MLTANELCVKALWVQLPHIPLKRKNMKDRRIKPINVATKVIRTYNFKRNEVKDHRSKKTAPLGKFLEGKVDLEDFSN